MIDVVARKVRKVHRLGGNNDRRNQRARAARNFEQDNPRTNNQTTPAGTPSTTTTMQTTPSTPYTPRTTRTSPPPSQYSNPISANMMQLETPQQEEPLMDNDEYEEVMQLAQNFQAMLVDVSKKYAEQTEEQEQNNVHFQGRMAWVLPIRVSLSYIRANEAMMLEEGQGICISDSGANSNVLGKGWSPIAYTERKATVEGYDEDMVKGGLKIGTLAAVTKNDEGKDILCISNESAHNPTCNTSLASEYQLREYGHIIDSTSKKHIGPDGQPGRQCIILKSDVEGQEDAVIPLLNRNCMMSFYIREPTKEELETLPRYTLTSPKHWRPNDEYDDSDDVIKPVVTNDIIANAASVKEPNPDVDNTPVSERNSEDMETSILDDNLMTQGNINTEGPNSNDDVVIDNENDKQASEGSIKRDYVEIDIPVVNQPDRTFTIKIDSEDFDILANEDNDVEAKDTVDQDVDNTESKGVTNTFARKTRMILGNKLMDLLSRAVSREHTRDDLCVEDNNPAGLSHPNSIDEIDKVNKEDIHDMDKVYQTLFSQFEQIDAQVSKSPTETFEDHKAKVQRWNETRKPDPDDKMYWPTNLKLMAFKDKLHFAQQILDKRLQQLFDMEEYLFEKASYKYNDFLLNSFSLESHNRIDFLVQRMIQRNDPKDKEYIDEWMTFLNEKTQHKEDQEKLFKISMDYNDIRRELKNDLSFYGKGYEQFQPYHTSFSNYMEIAMSPFVNRIIEESKKYIDFIELDNVNEKKVRFHTEVIEYPPIETNSATMAKTLCDPGATNTCFGNRWITPPQIDSENDVIRLSVANRVSIEDQIYPHGRDLDFVCYHDASTDGMPPDKEIELNFFDSVDGLEDQRDIQRNLPFLDTIQHDDDEHLLYVQPSDNFEPKERLTKAFHLELDDEYCKGCYVREHEVDRMLDNMDDKELYGINEPFDTFAYAVRVSEKVEDLRKLQPYLGYRPIEVIRKTLQNTTQLAMNVVKYPMKRHFKSLGEYLNKPRLRETVGTDTIFSSVRDVSGAWCAQVYWGFSSHMINVYGMKTESEMPNAQDDFMREEGIPDILRSDNARVQRYGKEMLRKLRRLLVGVEYTEPHHPQQNPAEMRAIRWLKDATKVIRARTGAPANVWLQIMEYMSEIHNITSDETLNHKVPHTKRHGETIDISPYLQHTFYERVYYHDPDESYPSTKELPGWWVGVSKNVGHVLTYKILKPNGNIIERSVVRSAMEPGKDNKAVKHDPSMEDDPGYDGDDDLIVDTQPVPETTPNPRKPESMDKPASPKIRRSLRNPELNPYFQRGATSLFDKESTQKMKDMSDEIFLDKGHNSRNNPQPDTPKPANHEPPPVERRSLRNRSKRNPTFRALKAMTLLSLFAPTFHRFCNYPSPMNIPDEAASLVQPEDVSKTPSYELNGLSSFQMDQLKYVQTLDLTNEQLDRILNGCLPS